MRRDAAIRRTVAVHVPELRAELGARRALRYGAGSGPASGVASHVRAASGLRRLGSRLFIVQDDVNALAVMDASGCIEPLLMPAGTDGRRSFDDTLGNKHLKMDLEAAVHLPDARLLAFGSGSARTRESIVIVEPGIGLRVRRAPGLYARLREHCEAAGAELNIEGAVIQGHRLRLFQRGNGARDSLCRSAASCSTSNSLSCCDGWTVAGPFQTSWRRWRSISARSTACGSDSPTRPRRSAGASPFWRVRKIQRTCAAMDRSSAAGLAG